MQNMVIKKCNKETLQNLSKGRLKLKLFLDHNNISHEFVQEKIYVNNDDNIDVILIYNQTSSQLKNLLQSLNYNFANSVQIDVSHDNKLELLIPYRSYKYTIDNNYFSRMLFKFMFLIFNLFFFLFLFLIIIFFAMLYTGNFSFSNELIYNYLMKKIK